MVFPNFSVGCFKFPLNFDLSVWQWGQLPRRNSKTSIIHEYREMAHMESELLTSANLILLPYHHFRLHKYGTTTYTPYTIDHYTIYKRFINTANIKIETKINIGYCALYKTNDKYLKKHHRIVIKSASKKTDKRNRTKRTAQREGNQFAQS
jgi:hypothetical protein